MQNAGGKIRTCVTTKVSSPEPDAYGPHSIAIHQRCHVLDRSATPANEVSIILDTFIKD